MAAVSPAQHAHTAGEPSACIHKANGHDTVEPGVGRTVAQGVVPLCGLQAQQLVALLNFERAQRLAVDGLGPSGRERRLSDAVAHHLRLHAVNKFHAGPRAEVLESGIVHGSRTFQNTISHRRMLGRRRLSGLVNADLVV